MSEQISTNHFHHLIDILLQTCVSLVRKISNMVTALQVQTRRLQEWREERQTLLQQQLYQLERKQKMEEIENTLKELQEKEEMIRFFELHDQIRLIQPKKLPVEKVVEEEDEEVLRAKRIKRRKFRHNV